MQITHALSLVNWLSVIAATIAAFGLGWLWYSNRFFGKRWLQEIGLTEESTGSSKMLRVFATSFLLQFIAATALAVVLGPHTDWLSGLHLGLLVGVCWVATSYGTTYLFEQRSRCIFFINGGYFVVVFAIMGIIIGAWPTTSA
jgi:hypothetical protein